MKKSLKVSAICMNSGPVVQDNIDKAFRWVERSLEQNVDWIVLPEMFTCLGEQEDIWASASLAEDVIRDLQELAYSSHTTIFAGSVPEAVSEDSRVYNTLYVLRSDGKKDKYRKIHLFHLEDGQGHVLVSEKKDYLSGDEPRVVEVDGWKVGLGICYDLRFPDLFSKLSKQNALDAIVLPSAFTKKTGSLHWELLLRARAVEQQCYVVGSNQTGKHTPSKESYGYSMIVDPWGKVEATTSEEEGLAISTIDFEVVEKTRSSIPVYSDRRYEVYG